MPASSEKYLFCANKNIRIINYLWKPIFIVTILNKIKPIPFGLVIHSAPVWAFNAPRALDNFFPSGNDMKNGFHHEASPFALSLYLDDAPGNHSGRMEAWGCWTEHAEDFCF